MGNSASFVGSFSDSTGIIKDSRLVREGNDYATILNHDSTVQYRTVLSLVIRFFAKTVCDLRLDGAWCLKSALLTT